MSTVLIHDDDGAFELRAVDESLVFSVLCGGIGLFELVFELDAEESAEYSERGVPFLRELADQVRRDPIDYRSRNSPTSAR